MGHVLFFIAGIWVASDFAHADAKIFRAKFSNAHGYLKVEFLSDDLTHFEWSSRLPGPAPENPITMTPMVEEQGFRGTAVFFKNGWMNGKNLKIQVDDGLCLNIQYLKPIYDIHRICPELAENPENDSQLRVFAPEYDDLFGLGQSFPQPYETNPSWNQRRNIPGPFGNELRWFSGGAVGFTQIPILYALGSALKNFAIFIDSARRVSWDFQQSPWQVKVSDNTIRWFLMTGSSLKALRRSYMNLTGKSPLLPKRAFGFWISEFGYMNWQEVYENINALAERAFPIDGFALDLQWYGGKFASEQLSRMGTLEWDLNNFPSPETHIQYFKSKGINTMLIEQPYVGINLHEHAIMDAQHFLVRDCETCGATYIDHNPWWGKGGLIDFTNPFASQFWHNLKRRPLMNQHVNSHWCDLGEPEMFNSWAWFYGDEASKLHGHRDYHNLYNFFWSKGIEEQYQKNHSVRPFIMNRSGTAGSQRFHTAIWSGDIGGDLDSMIAHQRAQLHMSLSGIDYYGSDIGGFYRRQDYESQAKLYSLWLANSVLTDFPARTHMWNMDKSNENNPAIIGDVHANQIHLNLRYRLFPYLYSNAYLASKTGEPIIRPIFYEWQTEQRLRSVDLQKMIGPYLMMKVVSNFSGKKQIIFPPGKWFDYYTSKEVKIPFNRISDVSTVDSSHSLQLPLFVRPGAIIPMFEFTKTLGSTYSLSHPVSKLIISVYPDKDRSEFDFIDDDGESLDLDSKSTILKFSQIKRGQVFEFKSSPQALNFWRRSMHHVEIALPLRYCREASMLWNQQSVPQCSTIASQSPCWSEDEYNTLIKSPYTEFARLVVFECQAGE